MRKLKLWFATPGGLLTETMETEDRTDRFLVVDAKSVAFDVAKKAGLPLRDVRLVAYDDIIPR